MALSISILLICTILIYNPKSVLELLVWFTYLFTSFILVNIIVSVLSTIYFRAFKK